MIKIPSVGHLRYDRFYQSVQQIIEKPLEALSFNNDTVSLFSSIINLSRYIAELYEDNFISGAGDSSLIFSSQMTAIKTVSMMSDVGLNISQKLLNEMD